jgi:membrane protease YdiL (CAAX protease family)
MSTEAIPETPRPGWGPIPEIAAWGVFMLAFLSLAIVPAFFRDHEPPGAGIEFLATPVGAITIAVIQLVPLLIAYRLARKAGRSPRELGVNKGAGFVPEIALGVAAYAAFSIGFPLLAKPVLDLLPSQKIALPELSGSSDFLSWGVFALSVGIMEEWVLRGYGYGVLNAHLRRPWVSAVIVSALFGVAHLYQGWGPVVVLALFGLYLNALVIWRGSLIAPVVVHVLNDFLVPLFAAHAN